MIDGQVGVARPLAVAVDAALDLDGSLADGGQGVGHRAAGVVVEVGAEPGVGEGRPDLGHVCSTTWGSVPPLVSHRTSRAAPASWAARSTRRANSGLLR